MVSDDSTVTHGPIVEGETSVRKEPYSLPQGFTWDTLDLSSPTVVSYCLYIIRNYITHICKIIVIQK